MTENGNGNGSVLVVEDEHDYATLLAAMLRDGGYDVRVANDGVEALTKVQEQIPDLVTLDIQMPNKTGIVFFRELKSKAEYRNVPLVVVTGLTADDQDMATLIHSFLDVEHLPHPDAYLEKPVEADELLAAVNEAIKKHRESDSTSSAAT